MVVLSLDFLSYSIQDTVNTTHREPVRVGHGYSSNKIKSKRFNMTMLKTLPTTTTPFSTINRTTSLPIKLSTTPISHSLHTSNNTTRIQKNKKLKKNLTHKNNVFKNKLYSNKNATTSKKDLVAKSNMHVLQFYAQPLNTLGVNVQPVNSYDTYNQFSSSNPLTENQSPPHAVPQNYITPIPTFDSIPYKTISDDYHSSVEIIPKQVALKPINYNWNQVTDRSVKLISPLEPISYSNFNWNPINNRPLKPIPMLDPFNLYKRNHRYRPKVLQPQKFIATVRPVTSVAPPITVTHVYKYTEGTGLKLPFVNNEEYLDDSVPILSAAIKDHLLKDRVANTRIKNYMTPPKINQPLYYNMPTATALPVSGYQNEFELINKFNNDLRAQMHNNLQQSSDGSEEVESQEKKNYNEEDLKKALEYIKNLKRSKSKSNRGKKKFKSDKEERSRGRKRKEKLEEDEDDGIEIPKKKRKTIIREFDDQNFDEKLFSDEDKTQEESRRNIIKAKKDSGPPALESQIVPSVNEEVCFISTLFV